MGKKTPNKLRIKRRLSYIIIPLVYGLIIGIVVLLCYFFMNKVADKYVHEVVPAAQSRIQPATPSANAMEGLLWR